MGDSLPPFRAVPFKPFVGPNQAAKRPCRWRHLEVWCLRRMRDPAYGAENNIPLGDRDAGQAMPLTNAGVLAHCARTGRNLADVFCRRVNGLECRYDRKTPSYDPVRRTFSFRGEVLRQFRDQAENEEPILQAFEKAGWPARIENPLPRAMLCHTRHALSDAVRNLSRHQSPTKRIRFWVERGTQTVCWEPISEDAGHEPGPACKPSEWATFRCVFGLVFGLAQC